MVLFSILSFKLSSFFLKCVEVITRYLISGIRDKPSNPKEPKSIKEIISAFFAYFRTRLFIPSSLVLFSVKITSFE